MNNYYMTAHTVDELRAMELALYNETHEQGKFIDGSEEYYNTQIELFEEAFASLFPDDWNTHKGTRPTQNPSANPAQSKDA